MIITLKRTPVKYLNSVQNLPRLFSFGGFLCWQWWRVLPSSDRRTVMDCLVRIATLEVSFVIVFFSGDDIFPEVADSIISDASRVLWDAQFWIRRHYIWCFVCWTQIFLSCFPSQVVWADNDVLTRNRPYPSSLPTPFSSVHSSSEGWSSTTHSKGVAPSKQASLDRWLTLLEWFPFFFCDVVIDE